MIHAEACPSDEVAADLEDLGPGPEGARRMVVLVLMALLEDPRVGIRDLTGILEVDPTLKASVLQRANSPEFWRRAGTVEDLPTAVRILGFRRIGRLIEEWGLEPAGVEVLT